MHGALPSRISAGTLCACMERLSIGCVYSLLGGLNRAVGTALWGAVVPVEQQAGDCKANEGACDG